MKSTKLNKSEKNIYIKPMENKLKTVSLETMINKHIGKRGTARQEKNLTQEKLGSLVGVQKEQISKIENSFTNARFDTILKVFDALGARITFNVVMK